MRYPFSALAFFSITITFFITSCKCKEDPIQTDLPQILTDLVPYQQAEILQFVNQSNDTVPLTVNERMDAFFPEDSPSRECPPKEFREILVAIDSSGQSFLEISVSTDGTAGNTRLTYNFSSGPSYVLLADQNAVITSDRIQTLSNQVIQGHTYPMVYVIEEVSGSAFQNLSIWIAPAAGLVRVADTNGNFLELL